MAKEQIINWLKEHELLFTKMASDIWENPQLAYEETFASDTQMQMLKDAGFNITSNICNIPTAFVAEYGSGKPIIGILGEFDALPGLSQTVSTTHEEITPNGPGHGCGHNLLGTAGVEAVMAIKEAIDSEGLKGTIRYYGCPAEEVLSGKTFMARTGIFNDLDCALTWHPGTSNFVVNTSMQAMVSVKYHFKGTTAHAAAAPHAGRSALDAVELMNIGANYMREHILDGSRIHYVITNGGLAPNIVPDRASVWYYLRSSTKEKVDEMLARLEKIAQGATMMTETEVDSEILAFAYETLPNSVLSEVMFENMKCSGPLQFTEEEQIFAEQLVNTVDPKVVKMSSNLFGSSAKVDELLPTTFLYNEQLKGMPVAGSTDVGDVSWIVPVGQVMTTCAPVGVQLHSWQATASFGYSIGMKGMHLAAKTMALSVFDLLNNTEKIEKAKEEFKVATINKPYKPGIPESIMPPLSENKIKLDPVILS